MALLHESFVVCYCFGGFNHVFTLLWKAYATETCAGFQLEISFDTERMHVGSCVCVMEFRKLCAAFLCWGGVSVLAELCFFPDVSIKYHTQILLVVLTARPPNQTEKGFIALPTSSIFKFCSRGSLPKFPRIHNFCYF